MKTVFEKPLIFDGDKEMVVLIYSNYIISEITVEDANLSIEKMNRETFNASFFESTIKIEEIFEYEFEPDNDTCIMFGVKNSEGTSYKNVEFKDTDTAKSAERTFKENFRQLGFKREEKQLTALSAASLPGIFIAIIAIIGGGLTWFSYELETWEPRRTMIVKWYVYIFVKLSKAIGYLPLLILTVLLLMVCLFWMIKRITNPPVKISAVK
ncbi:hypothetical protein ABXT06_14660 [Flavobacterium sp. UW10123]|uniref:hypothetical protein n=1 Tax=Flavobacterium sp. UW10123 TaxID=3230800 RepID=UPI0033923BD0